TAWCFARKSTGAPAAWPTISFGSSFPRPRAATARRPNRTPTRPPGSPTSPYRRNQVRRRIDQGALADYARRRTSTMVTVAVKLGNIGAHWTTACKQAVSDLNQLFRRKGIAVTLAVNGAGPIISVRTDPAIAGTAVHGKTSAETDGAGHPLN